MFLHLITIYNALYMLKLANIKYASSHHASLLFSFPVVFLFLRPSSPNLYPRWCPSARISWNVASRLVHPVVCLVSSWKRKKLPNSLCELLTSSHWYNAETLDSTMRIGYTTSAIRFSVNALLPNNTCTYFKNKIYFSTKLTTQISQLLSQLLTLSLTGLCCYGKEGRPTASLFFVSLLTSSSGQIVGFKPAFMHIFLSGTITTSFWNYFDAPSERFFLWTAGLLYESNLKERLCYVILCNQHAIHGAPSMLLHNHVVEGVRV